ncbi:hypothetical protein EYC80_004936 [Monilinia laxa]|uniref:Uncharacterized protein n=1 Tax=Monilinia laxa TaxID=61186 RepID=A0A5N6KIK8_MONLA|nr:hypothetical protein EYC80_004936 [Monilinia laxa]
MIRPVRIIRRLSVLAPRAPIAQPTGHKPLSPKLPFTSHRPNVPLYTTLNSNQKVEHFVFQDICMQISLQNKSF